MLDKNIRIERLNGENKDAFYAVHSKGEYGDWCNCVAWWVPSWEGWGERTKEQNSEIRQKLFDQGIYDGYLLYVDEVAAGWCQVIQRDQLPNLVNFYHFEPDPRVWAISCFMILPDLRGKGLAHQFLAGILADLKGRGVGIVQAYPRVGEELTIDDIWTGPEAIYKQAGFSLKMEHPRRPIVELRF